MPLSMTEKRRRTDWQARSQTKAMTVVNECDDEVRSTQPGR